MSSEHFGPRLKALTQERADLLTEAERVLATAAAESRELTDDEKKRDDEIAARVDVVADEITRYERIKSAERAATLDADEAVAVGKANGDPMCGFSHAADFAQAVFRASAPGGGAIVDERLVAMMAAPANITQTGGTAGEGYLVPPQLRAEVFELMLSGHDELLNRVTIEPTSSNAVDLDADETTPWGSTGVTASWRAEGSQMTATKPDTDHRQTRIHELYAFVNAGDELLADAPRLNDRLTRKASAAIRWKASNAIANGTGAGQPLGFKHANYDGGVAVAKETSQTADTVVAGNVAKMYARQLRLSDAIWAVNQDVLPQLFTMTLGDNSIYVPPATGFQQAPGGFLLGRPVVPVEHMETVGDAGDIALWSPSGYHAIAKGGGIEFASSMHLFFDYGLTAFRWTFRFGGQPFLAAAVSPQKGSSTRSHTVTLAARA